MSCTFLTLDALQLNTSIVVSTVKDSILGKSVATVSVINDAFPSRPSQMPFRGGTMGLHVFGAGGWKPSALPKTQELGLVLKQTTKADLKKNLAGAPLNIKIKMLPWGSRKTIKTFGTLRTFPGVHYAPPVLTHRGWHEFPQNLRFQMSYKKYTTCLNLLVVH